MVQGALDRETVMKVLAERGQDLGKRELARALGVSGDDRVTLKRILRELKQEGLISTGRGKRLRPRGTLPNVALLTVTSVDEDGELIALYRFDEGGEPATITLPAHLLPVRPPGVGDRVLARIRRQEDGLEGKVIKVLPRAKQRVLGVLEQRGATVRLRPSDRAAKEVTIEAGDLNGAEVGEWVAVELIKSGPHGLGRGRVQERLGRSEDPRNISRLAAAELGLRERFSTEALAQAEQAEPVILGRRLDLRTCPLVTIDGADARDFDDAVFAEPDPSDANRQGFRLIVAIADVAHYVRAGDALDEEALARGNSVYFPDRMIPMLPEALSNGLCSLKPDEDRACDAVTMTIDAEGQLLHSRIDRALMRSSARLTYEQVQQAIDGEPDESVKPLVEPVIKPLFAAWKILDEARRQRGTLDLDLGERKLQLDETGAPINILMQPRLDAHRVIEELMVLTNVATARLLESKKRPCLYRVHDKPDPVKVEALSQYLRSLGLSWKTSGLTRPRDFQRLLRQIRDHELAEAISGFVLRAQSQAIYSPHGIGHFGLNLQSYAHFTSPIRRYADLVVHRQLIDAFGLGDDGGTHPVDHLETVGERVSSAERQAMEAERKTVDRLVALFLSDRIGSNFPARISGVQRVGLFVRLTSIGVDGFVPVSTLGSEYFAYNEASSQLIGEQSRICFSIGDPLEVSLAETDTVTGGLLCRVERHEPLQKPAVTEHKGGKRNPGKRTAGRPKRRGR
ncbi:MAG: ribonuclease R [Geminicoccaceae bacterium]